MNIQENIRNQVISAIEKLYNHKIAEVEIQVQITKKEFEGDFTIVVFGFLKISKKAPDQTANEIGNFLLANMPEIAGFNVIKGFLNLVLNNSFWIHLLNNAFQTPDYGFIPKKEGAKRVVIEFSSPNTNKPLHLGHIRNNLLGNSVANILKANGSAVFKVNLVNDRGIHICKSMLAYQRWGKNETPETAGIKGDKLVGKYYVIFDQEYKKQIGKLMSEGLTEDEAKKQAPLINEAQDMLIKWEAKDKDIIDLWKKLNSWVYNGFDFTYRQLGIEFDKIYYESETYLLGREMVLNGVKRGLLVQKPDTSIWIDLTTEGLDEKILLRSDGTSVYITQDIGTANLRYSDYQFDKQIYVVGNEQDYHFKVLIKVLSRLGYNWAENLFHLSYGMVELPEGKMKSREGTVVDADDLIAEMIKSATEISDQLGKLENFPEDEKKRIYNTIGLGALKYFILKIDPKKNILFNPSESIDFDGNTGPFIQYTYTRIFSVLKKANESQIEILPVKDAEFELNKKELQLLKLINQYPEILKEAGDGLSPALVANFVYDVAKDFNQFYHEFSILKEENIHLRNFRLVLASTIAGIIKSSMALLGIIVPERM